MSTASKVLTVLVMLATVGWLYLITMVATLNRGYGEKVVSEKAALVQKQEALSAAKLEIARAQRLAENAQDAFGRQQVDLQGRLDSAVTQRALSQEIQTRLAIDQESMQKAGEDAAQNQEFRKTELEKLQTDRQTADQGSQASQKRNEELRAELDRRRGEFQQLLQDNQRSVGQ